MSTGGRSWTGLLWKMTLTGILQKIDFQQDFYGKKTLNPIKRKKQPQVFYKKKTFNRPSKK